MIVLNVWEGKGEKYGHYSMSIIKGDEDIFYPLASGAVKGNEIVISYGPYMKSNDKTEYGAVTICEPLENEADWPDKRYILGKIDYEQYRVLDHILYVDSAGDVINDKTHYVKCENFALYSIPKNAYCGSFVAYLLDEIVFVDEGIIKEYARNEVFTRLLASPQYVNRNLLSEGEDYLVDFLDNHFVFYTEKIRRK